MVGKKWGNKDVMINNDIHDEHMTYMVIIMQMTTAAPTAIAMPINRPFCGRNSLHLGHSGEPRTCDCLHSIGTMCDPAHAVGYG